MGCGRIRKPIHNGLNLLVDGQLEGVLAGFLSLDRGEQYTLNTRDDECVLVLIQGQLEVVTTKWTDNLGPRANPFYEKPWGMLITKDEQVTLRATEDTLVGIGFSPAKEKMINQIITPEQTGGGDRGRDNWSRHVRFVCWSDNTVGNRLLAGETVTPSGNWSTIPPHRHQYLIEGEEVPYEEVYLFTFTRDTGFGLVWQFDDEGDMDQAFSIRMHDAVYMDRGYHPVACAPGADLYQLTFIAGDHRQSVSSLHRDYRYIVEQNNMENPYRVQRVSVTSPDGSVD